jgi:hypothetical protein
MPPWRKSLPQGNNENCHGENECRHGGIWFPPRNNDSRLEILVAAKEIMNFSRQNIKLTSLN